MRIEWNANISEKHRQEIEHYFLPYLFLVPKWVQLVCINLYDSDGESGDTAISIDVVYNYRRLKINFYAGWLTESDEAKQMHVIHELCHSFTCIIADYAGEVFDNLCRGNDDDKLNKTIKDELIMRCESATQDLAFAILEKFNERT